MNIGLMWREDEDSWEEGCNDFHDEGRVVWNSGEEILTRMREIMVTEVCVSHFWSL